MVPPYDLAAERSILSAMLHDKQSALASQRLSIDDFYDSKHKSILTAIQKLVAKGAAVDMLTTTDMLRDDKKLTDAGGGSYVATLAAEYISVANFDYHLGIVKEHSLKRQAILKGNELLKAAYQGSIDDLKSHIHDITQIGHEQEEKTYEGMETLVLKSHEEIEKRFNHKDMPVGIQTGFIDLDKMIIGMQGGDYVMIAARPSMGKTALALNIADYVAQKEDGPCVFFSLEMQKAQVMDRLFAQTAMINLGRIRSGRISNDEWKKINQAAALLSQSNLIIDDSDSLTTVDIEYRLNQIVADRGKPSLVVIDYLQYVRALDERASETDKTTAKSRDLKALAKRFDVPFLILSQLSRGPEARENKRPMLSDLRQSGGIEQDADIVMMLYRDEYYNPDTEKPNVAEVIIEKQRNGPTGTVELLWMGEYQRFRSLERYRGQ